MRVALLGVGLMGRPMAQNIAGAGHELHVWNRTVEKARAVSASAVVHTSPAEAVLDCDCVICMLYDGPVTSHVLLDQGVMEACPQN